MGYFQFDSPVTNKISSGAREVLHSSCIDNNEPYEKVERTIFSSFGRPCLKFRQLQQKHWDFFLKNIPFRYPIGPSVNGKINISEFKIRRHVLALTFTLSLRIFQIFKEELYFKEVQYPKSQKLITFRKNCIGFSPIFFRLYTNC